MRFLFLIALTCCFVYPLHAEEASAQATVDGMLFFATDDAAPSATEEAKETETTLDPKALASLRIKLGKAFAKKNFQLLGLHTQNLLKDYDSWVVPSKELCLKIDSRGLAPDHSINLHLQLWQEKKVLVKSDTTLKPGHPIFIAGPAWRNGRLVIVLVMK